MRIKQNSLPLFSNYPKPRLNRCTKPILAVGWELKSGKRLHVRGNTNFILHFLLVRPFLCLLTTGFFIPNAVVPLCTEPYTALVYCPVLMQKNYTIEDFAFNDGAHADTHDCSSQIALTKAFALQKVPRHSLLLSSGYPSKSTFRLGIPPKRFLLQ